MGYKVFISFTEADKKIAEGLNAFIARGFRGDVSTYCSAVDMRAGMKWKEEIQAHLNNSDAIVCLVTP